tara:strand:- start:290 stop:739 length:450 start_codon:yes stop_codon:yes gene_type:complete
MDNFDLRKYLAEGRLFKEDETRKTFVILNVNPPNLELGDGFLPVDIYGDNEKEIEEEIKLSIFNTFDFEIKPIYDKILKDLEDKADKAYDDWSEEKITDEEYESIEDEYRDFDALEPEETNLIQIDLNKGEFFVENPDGENISGEFFVR